MTVSFAFVNGGVPLLFFCTFILSVVSALRIEVDTPVGRVLGFIDDTPPHYAVPNVAQFLGIPYAEPPVGPLRWLPPRPKAPLMLNSTINATAFGPSCSQYATSLPQVYNTDVTGFLIQGPTSEDCLTLNIWAPSGLRLRLPVIVWLYGGSFQTGGGDTPFQNPVQWVQRSQSHIVIGIKYVYYC